MQILNIICCPCLYYCNNKQTKSQLLDIFKNNVIVQVESNLDHMVLMLIRVA